MFKHTKPFFFFFKFHTSSIINHSPIFKYKTSTFFVHFKLNFIKLVNMAMAQISKSFNVFRINLILCPIRDSLIFDPFFPCLEIVCFSTLVRRWLLRANWQLQRSGEERQTKLGILFAFNLYCSNKSYLRVYRQKECKNYWM